MTLRRFLRCSKDGDVGGDDDDGDDDGSARLPPT